MSSIVVAGNTSGSVTLSAPAVSGSSVLTLPVATDTLVGKATTDTLTNKTLTSPVIATIVNSGTLTLPTSTDTLVGKATTDTLTNKSIAATQLTGTISAARLPTGSVLQVTWTNWTGSYQATSATNVDFTGFSTTFTPLYSTSKVLIFVSAGINMICDGSVYIKRNGTIVKDNWFGSSRADEQYDYPQAAQSYLDSPATTSTITYQMGGRAPGCGTTIRFGASDNSSSICLMEIAA